MSELRKCMVPGCEKMVVEEGYYFCGEHEHVFKDTRDMVGAVASGLVVLVVGGVGFVRQLKK
ncbi:hypothetical protein HAU46_10470 [Weissella confusa]|uniref:hypothetical protein n=1 Tax=Weissella confusa TaxID=1583 RepID=UPI0018F19736|nr:hypothetical protein [Weissella confusa]MBJ7648386.1 hypothetical protein [Weissella confusa]MBJ7680906.1 hypothetical protein [Weissella confusa]